MKKLLSLLLVAAMCLSLVACGNSNKTETSGENAASGESSNSSGEETTELVWAIKTWGTTPGDMGKVEDAINAYLKEKINVHVTILPIGLADWNEKMNVMLASTSEQVDLICMNAAQYSSYVSKGQLVDITSLLDTTGQGVKEAVGDQFLLAGQTGGVQYAVPSIRDEAAGAGFMISQEYVDKYNLDISSIKSLEDITPILKTIKDAEPNLYPLALSTSISTVEVATNYDTLSDNFGVLLNGAQDTTVENLYASDEYKSKVELLRQWYEAGYISPDASTKTESQANQVKAGTAACYIAKSKPGIEIQDEMTVGKDLAFTGFKDALSTTAIVQTLLWGIANNTQNAEKSMELLNLLYTDETLINLIDYGIEGTHYVVNEDSTISFPEGVTAENSQYNLSMAWQFGNQYLSHVWEGNEPDIYDQLKKFNDESNKSAALGFVFNNESVKTQVSALTAVTDQYKVALETGSVDPADVLGEFVSKLETAGINDVIAEKQKQLDEWKALTSK